MFDTMPRTTKHDEMRSHYDFSGGIRGKYAARYAEGTVVVLASDVAKLFTDSIAANKAVRAQGTADARIRAALKKRGP